MRIDESPDGEVELARQEEIAEQEYKRFNTPRQGELFCPADFAYDPLRER